jgi:hypothetical protein
MYWAIMGYYLSGGCEMKHDNRCKLSMVIGRLEALHTLDGSSAIAHIIGASLEDLRDIFADELLMGADAVKENKIYAKDIQR